MPKIHLIASYPKSGNTWFRAFLTSILGGAEKLDINKMEAEGITTSRKFFDYYSGIDSSGLFPNEIDNIRPKVYETISQRNSEAVFLKCHDAYTVSPCNVPLFPASAVKAAVYLIRNPLDIVSSYAHHMGFGTEEAIKEINDSEACLSPSIEDIKVQLRHYLLDWSGHVKSWTQELPFKVEVVRYEDLLESPVETFNRGISSFGIEKSEKEIRRAIEETSFEKLRKLEAQVDFAEKSNTAATFFRKGKAGSWKESLSDEQAEMVIAVHQDLMLKFGYIDKNGIPL